jgi:hypothetical protein
LAAHCVTFAPRANSGREGEAPAEPHSVVNLHSSTCQQWLSLEVVSKASRRSWIRKNSAKSEVLRLQLQVLKRLLVEFALQTKPAPIPRNLNFVPKNEVERAFTSTKINNNSNPANSFRTLFENHTTDKNQKSSSAIIGNTVFPS